MEFYASCPEGFEFALADELKALGLSHVRRLKGRATFEGDIDEGYRACLWSRLASRVFLVLGRFEAQDADTLYDAIYDLPWENIIKPGASIACTARGVTEQLRNTHFSALRAKDAICDRLAETTGSRADVDAADPDVHLLLSLRQRRASINLDLSGEPLFKRLPRAATQAAEGAHVLRPDYAALVLSQVGWAELCQREPAPEDYENDAEPVLIDASCAGGGILIEAANILADRAPGMARTRWGFEGWQGHAPAIWEQLRAEAREREEAARERRVRIVAADVDATARKTAERMVRAAGAKRYVDFCAAKPQTILDHAGVAGAAVVADTTETPLTLAHEQMTMMSELRAAPELAAAQLAALVRDELFTRALHAEPVRQIEVMPNNEEATVAVWPSVDDAAAAFARAEQQTADGSGTVTTADTDTPAALPSTAPAPEPAATIDLGDGKPLPVLVPESEQFANRLRKNARLRRKWARREGVTCYRVYDADLPDYSAAIDLYEGCPQTPGRWLVIAEYAAPKTIDPALAQARMLDILAIAPRILDVPAEHVHAKARMRSRGGSQYGKGKAKQGERANIARRRLPLIEEGGLTFAVNFDDYLDTGIFLDHRVTRELVREHAKSARRFLNLFAYTGTVTCYAADGGVEETVTVDLSNTYLDWAERNMRHNGFMGPQHHYVRADVLAWIRDQRQTRNRWDLIFVDPPTFSNSSKMGRRTWDVQRDHVELLAGVSRLLTQEGHAIFSCNLRGFRPEVRKLARAGVVLEDITAQTIPEDFARNKKVHHCYIVRRLPIEDAMAEVGFSAEEIAERTEELRAPKPQAERGTRGQAGDGRGRVQAGDGRGRVQAGDGRGRGPNGGRSRGPAANSGASTTRDGSQASSSAGKPKKKKFYASKPKRRM